MIIKSSKIDKLSLNYEWKQVTLSFENLSENSNFGYWVLSKDSNIKFDSEDLFQFLEI